MENTTDIQRTLWTPKKLAERAKVTVATLHFYEEKGLIFAYRTAGNQRRYNKSMVRRIAFIKAGQKLGITLTEIKHQLDFLPKNRTPTKNDWEIIAQNWHRMLNERIRSLEQIRDTLTSCIGCGCLSLQSCALYNPDDCRSADGNDLL